MGHPLRTAIGVMVLLLLAVILAARLPAPPSSGHARQCAIPLEPPRPLDLNRFADRAHLRTDAATAESWAIAYADVSPARQQGAAAYTEAQRQCMTVLFATVSERHRIDVGLVREYAGRREVVFDAAVLLLFAFAYVAVADRLVKLVTHRFTREERFARIAAVIVLSFMTLLAVIPLGEMWSIAAEILRVGNGHLSYRTERLPWRQHQWGLAISMVGLCWVVAAIRSREDATMPRHSDGVSLRT